MRDTDMSIYVITNSRSSNKSNGRVMTFAEILKSTKIMSQTMGEIRAKRICGV